MCPVISWFTTISCLPHAVNFSVFSVVCDFFVFFANQMSLELLNGFAPNSHGRRVWSLAWMSLKVKVKGRGQQGQKTAFFGPLGGLHAVCMW